MIPDCAAQQTRQQCHSQGRGVNYFRISMTAAKNIMTLKQLERLKQDWKLRHSHINPHIDVWWKQSHQEKPCDNNLKSKGNTMKQNSLCFAFIYQVPKVKLFLCSTLSRNCCALATWHGQGEMQQENVRISAVSVRRGCPDLSPAWKEQQTCKCQVPQSHLSIFLSLPSQPSWPWHVGGVTEFVGGKRSSTQGQCNARGAKIIQPAQKAEGLKEKQTPRMGLCYTRDNVKSAVWTSSSLIMINHIRNPYMNYARKAATVRKGKNNPN